MRVWKGLDKERSELLKIVCIHFQYRVLKSFAQVLAFQSVFAMLSPYIAPVLSKLQNPVANNEVPISGISSFHRSFVKGLLTVGFDISGG